MAVDPVTSPEAMSALCTPQSLGLLVSRLMAVSAERSEDSLVSVLILAVLLRVAYSVPESVPLMDGIVENGVSLTGLLLDGLCNQRLEHAFSFVSFLAHQME